MDENIRKELILLISDSALAIKNRDILKLREISNEAIRNASINQDQDSLSLAVAIYSLMKVMQRGRFDDKKAIMLLEGSKRDIESGKFDYYKKEISNILKLISSSDRRLKVFIDEVVQQAQIKKGGSLYEHGLSLGKAASLLGISVWDLMGYIGKTTYGDAYPGRVEARKRLETARGLFR